MNQIMLAVLACVLAAIQAVAATTPRVIYFDDKTFNTRESAIDHCMRKGNHHIATRQQIQADFNDGLAGHSSCGWTYDRQQPRHIHCEDVDKLANGNCKPGSPYVTCGDRQQILNGVLKFGVYCRIQGDDEASKRVEYDEGELVEVYRQEGPNGPNSIFNVGEARAVCEKHGNTLAYWSQAAAYADRYDIEICKFSWLRYSNALYSVNCGQNGRIDWQIYDDSKGADAICIGQMPHPYKDPCQNGYEFQAMAGVPVECSNDGYIIIQDRPKCSEEEPYAFKQDWYMYKTGFGKMGKGYWFGLAKLAKITKMWKFKLVIEVARLYDAGTEKERVVTSTAKYRKFTIGSLEEEYPLHVEEYYEEEGDTAAGDMFNTMQGNGKVSNGQAFSAEHRDNDGSDDYNCAIQYKSGWWFQDCHLDNLNGLCDGEDGFSPAINSMRAWRDVSKGSRGLYATRMKIKYVGSYAANNPE